MISGVDSESLRTANVEETRQLMIPALNTLLGCLGRMSTIWYWSNDATEIEYQDGEGYETFLFIYNKCLYNETDPVIKNILKNERRTTEVTCVCSRKLGQCTGCRTAVYPSAESVLLVEGGSLKDFGETSEGVKTLLSRVYAQLSKVRYIETVILWTDDIIEIPALSKRTGPAESIYLIRGQLYNCLDAKSLLQDSRPKLNLFCGRSGCHEGCGCKCFYDLGYGDRKDESSVSCYGRGSHCHGNSLKRLE